MKSDSSNSEARSQLELTEKLSEAAREAEKSFSNKVYDKAAELLSTIIEVCQSRRALSFSNDHFSRVAHGPFDYVNYVLIVTFK